jgi:hypothetical protein
VSDMGGERNLSAPRGQQLPHVCPFRGGCLPSKLSKKNRGVPAKNTKFRDRKGNEADVGAPFQPSYYFSSLVFSARYRATSRDGGLEMPNKQKNTASIASFEPRMPW